MKNIIINLVQYINSMKIRKQLLLTYLAVGIIPILLIGIYLVSNTRNLVLAQQESETKAENLRIENSINQVVEVATDISSTLFFDSDLRNVISTKYSDVMDFVNNTENYTRFGTLIQDYSEIKNIEVYSNNDTIFDSLHFKKITPDIQKQTWYKNASCGWNIIWASMTDDNGEECLSLVRQIKTNSAGETAILVINLRRDYFCAMVEDSSLKTLASVENGSIFLSNNYNDLGTKLNFKIPNNGQQDVKPIDFGKKTVLAALDNLSIGTSKINFYILTLNDGALKHANDVTLSCCIILFFSLILPFLILFYFSGIFSKRINLLRSEMNRAASGDLEIPLNPGGNDEISELYNDLNVMIDGIKNLLSEVYLEKLIKERMINSQQKIEFKMLASQINPHFLYNTLETIRMKLICNGDRETANVIKILGKTIRRMLEVKDEIVTLDSELEYIRYYLEIQRFRFGSRIEYEIKTGNSINAKEIYLLPLLLQPIVENAFVHGLEDKDGGGKITVDIHEGENALEILIEDNGIGISPEKCDFLNSSLQNIGCDSTDNNINGSIGLCNVHQRITLHYGKNYGVKIMSRLGSGTKVLISLPLDGEVMIKNEGLDHR